MTAAAKKAFVKRMAAARKRKKPTAKKKNPAFLPKKLFDRYDVIDARSGKVFNKGLQTLSGARKKARKKIGSCEIKIVSQQTGSTVETVKNPRRRNPPIKRIPKKAIAKKRIPKKRRRNPADMAEASAMYEQFHGRAPARIIEHSETLDYRSELAELGKLLELRIKINGDRATLDGFGNCQVACDPDGKNIAFLGGNQTIDLDALGIESDKDLIELGELTYIKYFSRKGFHDFAPIDYFHHVGEVDGIRPMLSYDTFNKKLFLLGGNYQVKPAGIEN
jgi:hypothetical protein